MYVCMCTSMFMYVSVHVSLLYVCMYVYLCVHECMCVHSVYIYMCIYAHIYVYWGQGGRFVYLL